MSTTGGGTSSSSSIVDNGISTLFGDAATIRMTLDHLYSIIDVTKQVTGKNGNEAGAVVRSLRKKHPEFFEQLGEYQFPGARQSFQSVLTHGQCVDFITMIQGNGADNFRREVEEARVDRKRKMEDKTQLAASERQKKTACSIGKTEEDSFTATKKQRDEIQAMLEALEARLTTSEESNITLAAKLATSEESNLAHAEKSKEDEASFTATKKQRDEIQVELEALREKLATSEKSILYLDDQLDRKNITIRLIGDKSKKEMHENRKKFDELRATLKKERREHEKLRETVKREQMEKEVPNSKKLEKLVQKGYGEGVDIAAVLTEIYKLYPPLRSDAKFERIAGSDGLKKMIKTARLHYHPDHQSNGEQGHQDTCTEITKLLNHFSSRCK
jgi:hypothetical protein